jgi:hypothetical protein
VVAVRQRERVGLGLGCRIVLHDGDLPSRGRADTDPLATRPALSSVLRGGIARERHAGTDGDVTFRVLDVRPIASYSTYSGAHRPAAGAAFFQVRTQVANDGTKAADPFCGSNGVRIVDSKDREFKPSSDSITIDGNETSSDGERPGFRNTETLVFEVPAGAVPASVELWNKDDGDDYFGDATSVRVNLG